MKIIATAITAGALLLGTAGTASAGPTCENMFGTGWKNHGEHVLHYVADGGAGGGKPAHHSDDRATAPAPGASFCLGHAGNPGLNFENTWA